MSSRTSESDLPTPQETKLAAFTGRLSFPCCGVQWSAEGKDRSTVNCGKCGRLYGLSLLPYVEPYQDQAHPKGARVRLLTPYDARVGAVTQTLQSDEYLVSQDTHGILGGSPDHTLLEVFSPGERGTNRTLVAFVPNHLLERVPDGLGNAETGGSGS